MIYLNKLNRRAVLRGVGALITLPMLESIGGEKSAADIKKNLAYFGFGFGVTDSWWPEDTKLQNYKLSPVFASMKAHQDKFSILRGCLNPQAKEPHSACDTLLTSANVYNTPGKRYQNSISCDQIAAEQLGKNTRYSSLVLSSPGQSTTDRGWGPGLSLSWNKAGFTIPGLTEPMAIYNQLFGGSGITPQQRMLMLEEKKSMLDSLVGDIKRLTSKISKADQQQVEQYITSIRDIEIQLVKEKQWIDTPFPQATIKKPNSSFEGGSLAEHKIMYDLIVAAFQSGNTHVASYRQSTDGILKDIGYAGTLHGMNHRRLDPGNELAIAKETQRLQGFAHFLGRMDSTKDIDGNSLLHNSAIFYGSGVCTGHGIRNIPLVVAGNAGGRLKQGQQLDLENMKVSNVHLSLLKACDVNVDQFSDSDGTIEQLYKA